MVWYKTFRKSKYLRYVTFSIELIIFTELFICTKKRTIFYLTIELEKKQQTEKKEHKEKRLEEEIKITSLLGYLYS